MTLVFAQLKAAPKPWLLGGWPESASTLELSVAGPVVYADGSPTDTLPARTLAAVLGGGTTFDRTAATWLAYTVRGSNVLSVCREADVGSLTGACAVLACVTLHEVIPYPQAVPGGLFTWITVTADYTITAADLAAGHGVAVDASAGSVYVTLPSAASMQRQVAVKRLDGTYPTNVAAVLTPGGETIDGGVGAELQQQDRSIVFGSDGSQILVVADYIGPLDRPVLTPMIYTYLAPTHGLEGATYLARDPATGIVYVSESNDNVVRRIRRISAPPTRAISVVVPNSTNLFGHGLACNAAGDLYIATWVDSCIWRVPAGGTVGAVAYGTYGVAGSSGNGGPATAALFLSPVALCFDPAGNLWIADQGGGSVRRIDHATGIITLVASGYTQPHAIASDASGNIFFGLRAGSIYRIDNGTLAITTVVTHAVADSLWSLACDAAGNVYASTRSVYSVVYKYDVTSAWAETVYAGTLSTPGWTGDGGSPTAATLTSPLGLMFDTSGNLYIGSDAAPHVRVVGRNVHVPDLFSSYYFAVQADSPLSWYRLDEAQGARTLTDSGSAGIAASTSGTITWEQPSALPHDADTSVLMSGAGSLVADTHAYLLTDCALEAWVNTTDASAGHHGLWGQDDPGVAGAYIFFGINGGLLEFGSSADGILATKGVSIADGAWHHVAVVRDTGAGVATWYVDGVSVGTAAGVTATTYNMPGATEAATIGAVNTTTSFTGAAFVGGLDEVAVYGAALSAARIAAHYAAR